MSASKMTCKVLEAMDDGLVSPRTVAEAALACMSEDQVADMVRCEELLPMEDEDDEDDND